MAEYALFIGFGPPRAGKEAAALKNFEESAAFTETLRAAGEIESVEYVLLNSHGGDLNGFFLLRGEPEQLVRLSMAPEFQRLVMRAGVCSEGLGVVNALVDAGVMRSMAAWKEAVSDLI